MQLLARTKVYLDINILEGIKKIQNSELELGLIYPLGIILNKHNIDNKAVTYHFNFIFNGNEYIIQHAIK